MISPMCFKVRTEDDNESDYDSDSDESIDMDDDAMVFEFGDMMSKFPDQSSRFTEGDMAPKLIMVEKTQYFPFIDTKQIIIVDDTEEE